MLYNIFSAKLMPILISAKLFFSKMNKYDIVSRYNKNNTFHKINKTVTLTVTVSRNINN